MSHEGPWQGLHRGLAKMGYDTTTADLGPRARVGDEAFVRRAHGRIQPSLVSMVAAQPLRAASVEGICQPQLDSQH